MKVDDSIHKRINSILSEINYDINLLYVINNSNTRNMVLSHTRDKIAELKKLVDIDQDVPILHQSESIREFTTDELSKYDGTYGSLAYVAVNGIVYDVTNNASWAKGTHFGHFAGYDLTDAFASCHEGERVLNHLPVVGRLV